MKKISIILAMAAMVLGFSSCKQEDEPVYHAPTTFTVNEPTLKNQVFRTKTDMTDKETFDLYCSQPDYGYSAICEYSALVSLNPDAPIEEWKALPNENSSSAKMAIKTYELGVAINQLLNVENAADFDARDLYNKEFKCYFKAVCEIPGIEGSKIISSNTVTYNKVMINYAEKLPAWIYIVGDVRSIETGLPEDLFLAPIEANFDTYKANLALFEPDDMIGEKLYVGCFKLIPKEAATNPDTLDPNNSDHRAQFRFFTELSGWSNTENMLGSGLPDFNNLDITDKWANMFSGDITTNDDNAKGNWGALITEPTDFTVVVDVPNLKIFIKEGVHEVSFVGRDPEFN